MYNCNVKTSNYENDNSNIALFVNELYVRFMQNTTIIHARIPQALHRGANTRDA